MPMFHSQTAIAYNPDLVKNPPNTYAELRDWVKKNPKQFGYNGIKGGMSGVAFVTGWVSAFGGDAAKLEKGPYDAATKATWDKAMADLKEFNKNVVITPGNAGTLDMLNRGEIAMGPVWVDMFYTWKADGKLPPNMRLKLVSPGMPGQPMYYAIPAKTAQEKLAAEFIALATSPEVQAEGIVKRFNWYPGIDAKNLEGKLDQGGLEPALRRHHAGRARRPTASRSRSGRTSTTFSKPTRRRSRTDRSVRSRAARHPAAARLLVARRLGRQRPQTMTRPSFFGLLLIAPALAMIGALVSLSARLLARRRLHRAGRRLVAHAFREGVSSSIRPIFSSRSSSSIVSTLLTALFSIAIAGTLTLGETPWLRRRCAFSTAGRSSSRSSSRLSACARSWPRTA